MLPVNNADRSCKYLEPILKGPTEDYLTKEKRFDLHIKRQLSKAGEQHIIALQLRQPQCKGWRIITRSSMTAGTSGLMLIKDARLAACSAKIEQEGCRPMK